MRLDVGMTKNREGRSFYVTVELRDVLEAQLESIEARGTICPYVFHRPDGSPLKDLRETWKNACEAAGYAGKLFTTSGAVPCAPWNAPACRARPRWPWWGTRRRAPTEGPPGII